MREKRRRKPLGATRVDFDRERVAEMRDRPDFYKKTAAAITKAACRISKRGDAWGYSGRKVFLSDVAREVGSPMRRFAPIAVAFNNLGWIRLARADLVGAMDPKKVAASEIDVDGRSTFHFVEIDPDKDCPNR